MIYTFEHCGDTREVHCSIKEAPPLNPTCRSCGESMKRVYNQSKPITDPLYLRDGYRPIGSASDRLAQQRLDDKAYEAKIKLTPPSKKQVSLNEIFQKAGVT